MPGTKTRSTRQGLGPTVFPQFARLAANLASMEGFLLGGFEAVSGTAHPEMYTFEQLSTLLQGIVTVRETPVKRSRVNGGNAPSNPPTASLRCSDDCTFNPNSIGVRS
jgi:hypothetical protein